MRVTTSKSKNSESFYINFAYIDENGKSTSRIYRKLGTLKELSQKLNTDRDGVMAWAKEQARLDTEKYNKENEILSIPFSPNQLIEKALSTPLTAVISFFNLSSQIYALTICAEISKIAINMNLI